MRRIVTKREQRCFGRDYIVASSNVFFHIESSLSNSKAMQAARYVGINIPLTVRKFLNDVAPWTYFKRQCKQNNSPLSVDG